MDTDFQMGECSVCHQVRRVTVTPLDEGPICANCWADRHVGVMTPEEEVEELAYFNACVAASGMTADECIARANEEIRAILRRSSREGE